MMTTTAQPADRIGATRFFWAWLIGSAAFSMLGVVTHAQLGSARSPLIASVLAFVIVVVQLCATYGVHALVQARIVGAAYRCALAIAIAIAVGAFVLNFVALRDLVIIWADKAPVIAWIVPLIVDLGMTASTMALLALTNAQRAEQLHTITPVAAHPDAQPAPSVHVEVHNTVRAEAHAAHGDAQPAQGAHLEIAQRIVAQGVTRIAPERVAKVLAVYAQTAATPSIIARKTGVHHETVERILDAA
ncbi:hypothetical protein A5721_27920 [Mycobacterium vulneris]|nr:hypothetical protein A5721_27920 [Mycolicibacterium vulneris]